MLIEASDLPGDSWRQLDERTWRAGEADPDIGWAQRAKQAGSVTAWRSFEQPAASRWLWIQMSPLASPDDADAALDDVPGRMLKNHRAEVEVVSEQEISPPSVPHASRVWAYTQETRGRRGSGEALYLATRVDDVLAVTAASGQDGGWSWPDVIAIATLQCTRIHDAPQR
jgi:hypothetical protein